VLGHAVQDSRLAKADTLRVVDMGAGKGYLTFATHAFLSMGGGGSVESREVTTVGVDIRQDMVDKTNEIAAATPFCSGLSFEVGSIAEWSRQQGVGGLQRRGRALAADEAQGEGSGLTTGGKVSEAVVNEANILIALHACDTATDDALFYGINAGADVILSSPCCHKEVRRQLRQQEGSGWLTGGSGHGDPTPVSPLGSQLKDVLRHGILAERQAELVTDACRAALLEAAGYRASVFEFISSESTGKNLMICAVKRASCSSEDRREAQARACTLLKQFGIRHQRLAALMGVNMEHVYDQDGSWSDAPSAGRDLISFQ